MKPSPATVLPATLTAQLDSNRAFMMGFATATTYKPACRSWWLVVGFWWLGDNTLRRRFGSPSRCLETGSQRAVMQSPTTNH
jgi:hypothetical protein